MKPATRSATPAARSGEAGRAHGHAALPTRRCCTSIGTAARSACVFSRQTSVACTCRGIVGEVVDAEAGERGRPVEHLGHARLLLEVLLAQRLHDADDLPGEPRIEARIALGQDGEFGQPVGIVDEGVEAAPAQARRRGRARRSPSGST
jgi:hypothetical protein